MNQYATPVPTVRYHSLDAVRAFALLLGVVFHAAESFESNALTYWAIGDNSPSQALHLFRHASHSFRLELFFLIAGFFAHFLWTRRGIGNFIRNRLNRILAPLVVGWAVLYPIIIYIWLTGMAKSSNWDLAGIPEEYRDTPPVLLTIGFIVTLGFLQQFDLTHLWFLHQLLAIYVLALAIRFVVVSLPGSGRTFSDWLDHGFRRAVSSPWRVLVFSLVSTPLLYIQQGWSVDTPKESLVPELATTLLFGFIFAVGWALHRQTDLLETVSRGWKLHLALGLLLILPTRYMVGYMYKLGIGEAFSTEIRLGHFLLYGLMMWSFMLGFLGLFARFRRAESPAWRYIADSSYWLYLVHLPLVVSLQVWVAHWHLHWSAKFLLINLIAFPLLFLSYHLLVRSTFIGRVLNGRRYPFVFPFRKRAGRSL